MWMSRYQAAGVQLAVGALVEMTGRFSLYAAKGRMNFDVFSVTLAGEGQLRLQVANLARELEAMGLMAPERKRPLPAYPQVIGIVTSPRGSVIHDMLRTLRRRYPLAKVLFAGVPVDGPGAADAMVDGLAKVVFAGAEMVLLGRGGGSFEDLMPFNDRRLARTIAACPVPVVTGIGHETDTTIADMVSDVRASTPTAAAEAVAPAREETDGRLVALGRSLHRAEERRLDGAARALERVEAPSFASRCACSMPRRSPWTICPIGCPALCPLCCGRIATPCRCSARGSPACSRDCSLPRAGRWTPMPAVWRCAGTPSSSASMLLLPMGIDGSEASESACPSASPRLSR